MTLAPTQRKALVFALAKHFIERLRDTDGEERLSNLVRFGYVGLNHLSDQELRDLAALLEMEIPPAPWDNTQAEREGWGLFEVDGRIALQRIDEVGMFDTDADAIIHVAEKAAPDTASYHYRAIELIGRPAEENL